MKNKITYKTIGIALIIIAVIFCFSRYKQIKENEWKEDYNQVLKVYSDELSKFKKDYNIITSDVKGEDFFLFGMGNRKKILYKEGQLIDIDSSEVLYSQEIINDLILPHEYAVILKEKTGKTIKIYEDEEGVYILDDNGKVLIEGTSSHINLPDFKKYIYPNIMKVLHHEVLFNIKDSIPLPNIIVYDKPWYRDGMMMAMVLEKTNNVNLIKDFILNVPDVYDYQNRNIKEPDNLGQLLYMISLVSDKNHPLVTQVLEEAKKIEVNTSSSKYINGLTDFRYHPVYQTICLKYGLEALGIQNDYTIPDISSDEYMSLAWFHEGNKSDVTYDSDKYPYIGWAHYHTNKNGKIYISSSTYPLSWEKNASSANYDNMKIIGNFYVANKISPTHGWHASEMFLFLIEQI